MTIYPETHTPEVLLDSVYGGLTAHVMLNKQFIGAVKDDWILFR